MSNSKKPTIVFIIDMKLLLETKYWIEPDGTEYKLDCPHGAWIEPHWDLVTEYMPNDASNESALTQIKLLIKEGKWIRVDIQNDEVNIHCHDKLAFPVIEKFLKKSLTYWKRCYIQLDIPVKSKQFWIISKTEFINSGFKLNELLTAMELQKTENKYMKSLTQIYEQTIKSKLNKQQKDYLKFIKNHNKKGFPANGQAPGGYKPMSGANFKMLNDLESKGLIIYKKSNDFNKKGYWAV